MLPPVYEQSTFAYRETKGSCLEKLLTGPFMNYASRRDYNGKFCLDQFELHLKLVYDYQIYAHADWYRETSRPVPTRSLHNATRPERQAQRHSSQSCRPLLTAPVAAGVIMVTFYIMQWQDLLRLFAFPEFWRVSQACAADTREHRPIQTLSLLIAFLIKSPLVSMASGHCLLCSH